MLKSWKSPFKAFGSRGWGPVDGDADGPDRAPSANGSSQADASIVRLRNVMAELKVGDAEYDARNPALADDEQIGIADPVVRAAVAETPAASASSNGAASASNGAAASNGSASAASNGAVTAAPSNGAATSAPTNGVATAAPTNGAASAAAAGDEELSAAQKLIKEQRQAAEALLLEACMLEERLKGEAKIAQAAGECATARETVASALRLEQEAKNAARAVSERRTVAASERRDAENALTIARGEVKTAKTRVEELEQQLRDAKQAVEQAHSMVGLRETRVKECLAKEATAKRDGADITAQVVAAENARLEAEKEAKKAEERVATVKSGLADGTQDATGMSDVRALAEKLQSKLQR